MSPPVDPKPSDGAVPKSRKPVFVVAGPTASGKSALAVDLAEHVTGVVINADSMQIYRGLEVLTSAPDAVMRARVPHRLFGVLSPEEICSAGEWRDMAMAEIKRTHKKDLVPVVVGGTGLYLKSLIAGIANMPPIPAEIRARIRQTLKQEGSAPLHKRLLQADPNLANNLSPQDSQRICRALEVFEATGRSLSDWQREETRPKDLDDIVFTTILFRPPRDQLYSACDARFSLMLENGALEEVRRLQALGLDLELPAMKALGVPHLLSCIRGDLTLDEARRLGQQATRHYVKRQTTWFSRQIIADVILKSQYKESCWDEIFPKISNFILTCRA